MDESLGFQMKKRFKNAMANENTFSVCSVGSIDGRKNTRISLTQFFF